jgi:SAM-dependent methyltransferase
MSEKKLLQDIEKYYSSKIKEHGISAKGVDWKDEASQQIRFKQLLKVIDEKQNFSINDLGCGYGSLLFYMMEQQFQNFQYCGYDLSDEMILKAKEARFPVQHVDFIKIDNSKELRNADYTLASGIFNVKMNYNEPEWISYIYTTINDMNEKSRQGFSFNILTKYSDKEYMKENLYYADPLLFFDYCKRNFSRNVALLHDYELYEFTIIVRKN